MFRYGLSWPQARAILVAGSYVRRERWTDKRLFRTAGGLVWVDGTPARVVLAADFGRAEFLATDWTDMGFDQGDCIDHPGWTHIEIDETARWRAAAPETRVTNPPSWGLVSQSGRAQSYGRIVGRRENVIINGRLSWVTHEYWQHPFLKIPDPKGQTDWYGKVVMVPLMELVTYTVTPAVPGTGDILLARPIPNPFVAACRVEITGSARDVLLLNGRPVTLPAAFVLAAGASFTIAAKLLAGASQPVAALDLEIDFTLEDPPLPG